MQLAGACAASLLLWWIFPAEAITPARLGAPLMHPSIGSGAGFALEAIMTFFLVLAYFATTVDDRNAFKGLAAFAIGLVLTMDALCGGPLTGAAMNPARAFGPELVYNVWESYTWIYYAGPAVGAILAAVLYELMYLQPGVRISLPGRPGRRRAGLERRRGPLVRRVGRWSRSGPRTAGPWRTGARARGRCSSAIPAGRGSRRVTSATSPVSASRSR